jgi:hypothetical protein
MTRSEYPCNIVTCWLNLTTAYLADGCLLAGVRPRCLGLQSVLPGARFAGGCGLIRRVKRKALPTAFVLDPSRPMGGLAQTAIATIRFLEKAILPKANIRLGKVAESTRNSAILFVHP